MANPADQLTLQPTGDGSFTFYSQQFQEAFHSLKGAKQEAEAKFVGPAKLAERAREASCLRLLDICYGLGYNSAAALETIWQANPTCQVELWGLEFNSQVPIQAAAQRLLRLWSPGVAAPLEQLAQQGYLATPCLRAELLLGDARRTLQGLQAQKNFTADVVFLDPFSPPHCPQLWTVEFLSLVASTLKPTACLVTYSCAAAVRTALSLVGLQFGSTVPVGRRTPGTIAAWSALGLPLSPQEQEHLQTRAAVPYRDPALNDPAEAIHQRRQQEQQDSNLEPTSHWKRRWQA
ncbi:MnmC family methyltransferase [Leptolyngbya sp. FACHB-261]|uniref:tRNA (5-methylaminomethyl-2-thiouridine)(34)-methyltransferase MnmD n=1 Tax=Leptolyngbya sp. FACHB-261 TaxID=2692806 RepID=UPI0016849AB1|nr:MnmC family methyltransferase [Leptolyngbya sp. FACHB-261]MBD2101333.1 hypothetical protein [Leptolyngbya sp. FACHB-261]